MLGTDVSYTKLLPQQATPPPVVTTHVWAYPPATVARPANAAFAHTPSAAACSARLPVKLAGTTAVSSSASVIALAAAASSPVAAVPPAVTGGMATAASSVAATTARSANNQAKGTVLGAMSFRA
jgi:hypothetical protein